MSPPANNIMQSTLAALFKGLGCPKRASLEEALLEEGCSKPVPVPMPIPHLAESVLKGERVRVRDDVVPQHLMGGLFQAVQSCQYFGQNAGENEFYKGTSGFHVKFRDTHRHKVEEHFPFLQPVLSTLLRSECNVYYVNVFFARPDGQNYHVDNYYTAHVGNFRATDYVSVFYLSAPESLEGGELVVLDLEHSSGAKPPPRGSEGDVPVLQRVKPVAGRAVDFDGRLFHCVMPFTVADGETRASIVVEQCKLSRRHFLQTPKFNIYCQNTQRELEMA